MRRVLAFSLLVACSFVAWPNGRDESRPYGPASAWAGARDEAGPLGPAPADQEPVRVLFVGDIMLDGGPGHMVTNGGDPFAHVAAVLADADLTVGNLECAIVKQGHAVDKPYTFRGPAAALPLLKQHFTAVSLANNHSGDWGRPAFLTGLALLRENKLPYFGSGANAREARAPLVLTARGRRVALLGYNDFPPRAFAAGPATPGIAWLVEKDVLADIKAVRARADLVLLFLHWGEELEPNATPAQKAMARRFIEAGADAVVGSHPHVTQEIEWHRDRPIVYSLGNFVFDYFPYDPPLWRGWMAKLTFAGKTRPILDIIPVELDPAGIPRITKEDHRGVTLQPSASGSPPAARAGGRDAGVASGARDASR